MRESLYGVETWTVTREFEKAGNCQDVGYTENDEDILDREEDKLRSIGIGRHQ